MTMPIRLLTVVAMAAATGAAAQRRSFVNLSGLEYNGGKSDAQIFRDYVPPSDASWAAVKAAKFQGVRLPVSMERLQPDPAKARAGTLNDGYAKEVVDAARRGQAAGLRVIVDLHNFGQYWGNDIDRTSAEPAQNIRPMYLGIVGALAARLQAAGIWGFELGNEPKNLDPARCRSVMQDAVVAARRAGYRGTLFVPGAWWSSAQNGISCAVKDPLDNWVQDVHAYGDQDNSGTYKRGFAVDGVTHDTIVDRVRPAVEQAKARRVRVFVGEAGVPLADANRRQQITHLSRYLADNKVEWAYWTAGEWSGNDANSLQPALTDRSRAAQLSAIPADRD